MMEIRPVTQSCLCGFKVPAKIKAGMIVATIVTTIWIIFNTRYTREAILLYPMDPIKRHNPATNDITATTIQVIPITKYIQGNPIGGLEYSNPRKE